MQIPFNKRMIMRLQQYNDGNNGIVNPDFDISILSKNGHISLIHYYFVFSRTQGKSTITENIFLYLRFEYITDDEIAIAIEEASKYGHLNIIYFFYQFKPSIREYLSNNNNYYCIEKAAENGHFDVIKFLCENNVYASFSNSCQIASKNGHNKIEGYLLLYYFDTQNRSNKLYSLR